MALCARFVWFVPLLQSLLGERVVDDGAWHTALVSLYSTNVELASDSDNRTKGKSEDCRLLFSLGESKHITLYIHDGCHIICNGLKCIVKVLSLNK